MTLGVDGAHDNTWSLASPLRNTAFLFDSSQCKCQALVLALHLGSKGSTEFLFREIYRQCANMCKYVQICAKSQNPRSKPSESSLMGSAGDQPAPKKVCCQRLGLQEEHFTSSKGDLYYLVFFCFRSNGSV